MDWFYLPMLQWHALLAWTSVAFFLIRGLAFQFGGEGTPWARWAEWAMDARLRILVFGVDLLLTVTGLSLWGSLHYNPLRETWLLAKLLALLAYTVCAHWAMGRGEFRIAGYVAALAALGYMLAASITRSVVMGLA
ncbi:MAG: SirB2 family protein [Burkholderiaceae bacterium]